MQAEFRTKFKSIANISRSGFVSGVSVCTIGEASGHDLWLDEKTLQSVLQAASASEGGIKCKADHGSGVASIIGVLRNFRIDGDRVRGDLQLAREHKDFAYFHELISTQASNIGLSMVFKYVPEKVDKKTFVRVTKLWSIDLVSDPAANPNGLFSQSTSDPKTFGQAVAQFCLGGLTQAQAVEKAVSQHPALWQQWREAGCVEPLTTGLDTPGNFSQLISAQQRHGKSKADAVRYCVSKFPEAYQSWRTSGDTAHL